MGVTKTEIFSLQQNQIAQWAKAFAHPARVAILQRLLQSNDCFCGDLVEEIGLAQPTISQHLKELKNIGLIQGSTKGAGMCYCIDTQRWKEMTSDIFSFLHPDNGCCKNDINE